MTNIQKANEFIRQNKEKVNPVFRNKYHLMAPIGWINDPNGFIYYQGEYHLFYQFYPYDSVWGPMHWGHAKSKDLINWEELPVALAPSEEYDADGCFSGTAIEHDGKLYLFYTGHVENSEIKKEIQCVAVSEDGIHFEKIKENPVVAETHIKGIAPIEDFRDPKVFERNGVFYMLVATKTDDKCGQILLFESKNMMEWSFKSVFLEGNEKQGIMWECPDLFQLEGKDVLIMSPIQMPSESYKYRNRSSTVAFIGEVDWNRGVLQVDNYHEIDGGLDFYAPQTCQNEKGQRFMTAWMQMWDRNMPTNDLKHGWAGSMTLPRELYLEDNILKQKPVSFGEEQLKLKTSIVDKKVDSSFSLENKLSQQNHVQLEIDVLNASKVIFFYGQKEEKAFKINYDVITQKLSINRENIGYSIKGAEEPVLNQREIIVPLENNVLAIDIYGDTSSVEIFTHDGQSVTSTFFEESFSGDFTIKADQNILIKKLNSFDIVID